MDNSKIKPWVTGPEEMYAIFENAAILLILVNEEGRVVHINRSGVEMTGKRKEELIGLLGGEVFNCVNAWSDGQVVCGHGRNCPNCSVRNLVNDTFGSGKNHYKIHGNLEVLMEGQALEMDLLISTSRIKVNGAYYVLLTIDDITQLKKQEEELKRLNYVKDRFLSILAHDLRSPFNTLLGFTDLLKGNLHTYELKTIDRYITLISQITRDTYHLLDDLLLWAKSNSGKLPVTREEVAVKPLLEEIVGNYEVLAQLKSIRLEARSQPFLSVYADESLIKTVLRNLTYNAIKFTNNGGLVTLSAIETSGGVVLQVADTGVGIRQEKLESLFNLQQVQSVEKGTSFESGTGFGLVLSKELVEVQDGQLSVESEVGEGTTFSITLPSLPTTELK